MLQNAYFLAKIGADTAENEQHFAEILPTDGAAGAAERAVGRDPGARRRPRPPRRLREQVSNFVAGVRQTVEGSFERLYRSQNLQVNMRLKALAEIYAICREESGL